MVALVALVAAALPVTIVIVHCFDRRAFSLANSVLASLGWGWSPSPRKTALFVAVMRVVGDWKCRLPVFIEHDNEWIPENWLKGRDTA